MSLSLFHNDRFSDLDDMNRLMRSIHKRGRGDRGSEISTFRFAK